MSVLRDLELALSSPEEWESYGNPNGKLLISEEPAQIYHYVMGVDIGAGLGLTNSVIHVMRVGDIEDPHVQVAEWACDFLDNHQLAAVVDYVGRLYWDHIYDLPALGVVEINNLGEGTQHDLITKYNYTNLYRRMRPDRVSGAMVPVYGFQTSPKSRPAAVFYGINLLLTRQWRIFSPFLIDELNELTAKRAYDPEDEKSVLSTARGVMDDRFMAGCFACVGARDLLPERYNISEERERREERGDSPKRTWQNTAVSYNEMMQAHENIDWWSD